MFRKYRIPLIFLRRWLSSGIECPKVDRCELDVELKKLYSKYASVPIVIGPDQIFTGDEQTLIMPHNHQRFAAKFSYATENHIQFAIQNAIKVKEEWANSDVQYRVNCLQKAVDILSDPKELNELVAANMLGQAKTLQMAMYDICALLRMLRRMARDIKILSDKKVKSASDKFSLNYNLRPLDGFVASSGPINMTWLGALVALGPLFMGNVVLWRPPRLCVHSSFIVFAAMIKAGIPSGALQFMPANYSLFLNTVIKSPDLGAVCYAGRVHTLSAIWHNIAINLTKYKCFPRLVGECFSKGYHFVHESADIDLVTNCTINGAYQYSGQRPLSCARLYVPDSMWPDLRCELQSKLKHVKIGDPSDEDSFSSAIIHSATYDDVEKYLKYAEDCKDCDIVCGGNRNKSSGYFIEPTIVQCRKPDNRMLIHDIMGPLLGVYVYKKNKLNEALDIVRNTQEFGATGSIFSSDEKSLPLLKQKLSMTASNLFINNQCCGSFDSHLKFAGNRLSGTGDISSTRYYLLRFANQQIVETRKESEEKS